MRSPVRPASSPAAAYLGGYSADARRYDELLDSSGAIRPHWKALFDQLGSESGIDVTRRGIELTRRLITENGVTYNVYADPKGVDRPWALDPLPLMISAAESVSYTHLTLPTILLV